MEYWPMACMRQRRHGTFASIPAGARSYKSTAVPDPYSGAGPLLVKKLKFVFDTSLGVAGIAGECALGLISAGVAFFSMFALFPTIAALIALLGYFADPGVILDQAQMLSEFLPDQAFQILDGQLRALVAANVSTLGWASVISLLAALWSSRAGVSALIGGLNAVHQVRGRSNFLHIVTSIVLTLILIGVALVALGLVIILPIVLSFLQLGAFLAITLNLVKWIISIALLIFGVGLAYRYGPNRPGRRSRWLSPGLMLAVGSWAVASVGFSFYLSNFASYNRVYGSIGAVVALLMWFYISAYVILLGAALNAWLERHPLPADEASEPDANQPDRASGRSQEAPRLLPETGDPENAH
ncbi:YihY/virulence factor BrkB family protein [Thioclava sp. BHET1]|nr:YihY/virulence factor BrkB family protein [Thioclava sp. BHET1]